LEISAYLPNFESKTIQFKFVVLPRLIGYDFGNEIIQNATSTPLNVAMQLRVQLKDAITNESLTNITINASFNGRTYQFIEDPNQPGTYELTLNASDFQNLTETQTYLLEIKIEQTNFAPFQMTIHITMNYAIDPVLKVPYRYWIVIGISLTIALGALIIIRQVQKSRIPITIKWINSYEKLITKNKPLPDKKFATPRAELLDEQFGKQWSTIGLDLAGILGIKPTEINWSKR
jgi:hypothetical protein